MAERKPQPPRPPAGGAGRPDGGRGGQARRAGGPPPAAPPPAGRAGGDQPPPPRGPPPVPRLRQRYDAEIRGTLVQEFGYRNAMQAPKIHKVVLNIGLGEALQNARAM